MTEDLLRIQVRTGCDFTVTGQNKVPAKTLQNNGGNPSYRKQINSVYTTALINTYSFSIYTTVLINAYSLKQPDLYYFEAIKMTSQD